jgi:LacI family transcriptional regulator
VVSYVLNDGPKFVSPATRERVLAAVEQLGYQPNAAARALRRGRSDLFGFIVPSIANPLFATFASEVERAANERGATVITVSAKAGGVQVALDRLAAHQVDGVLIATPMHAKDIAALERSRIESVLLNQPTAVPGVPTFGVDLYGGARTAVGHLLDEGRRVIAYLGPADGDPRRRQGWLDAHTARGLDPGPHIPSAYSREAGHAAVDALLGSSPRVDAVFASSDQIALGVLLGLHERGISVPASMAIASFDDSPDARYAWPPLTAVKQPLARMADDALRLLIDREGVDERVYDGELIVRASTSRG